MVKTMCDGEVLTVFLEQEIDHYAAQKVRQEIEEDILKTGAKKLLLDFSDVEFMDSSGIGMIIGRYKTRQRLGGTVSACGLSSTIERIFRMAGLHRILEVKQKERREEA